MATTPVKYKKAAPKARAKVSAKVPAKEATPSYTTSADEKFVYLKLAPGWEHVLPKTMYDDPGCFIMWNPARLTATVEAFNNAIQAGNYRPDAPPPPAWLINSAGVPPSGPVTVEGLMEATLRYADYTGGDRIVGNAMIAPNTVSEYGTVCTRLNNVGVDPFFRAYAVCPIGRHYILQDRSQRATGVQDPIDPLPVAFGVAVFA